jgi:hypothetical protein
MLSREAGTAPYGVDVPLEECWIAYVERPVTGLESSWIVLVSRKSGEVVYEGSAGDEG